MLKHNFIIEYAKAQYKARSHIVQICDTAASPDLISSDIFRQFAKPALIEVADNLDGSKLLPSYLRPCDMA
jgi:uroporphyrinogen-III decarboxylase